MNIERLEQQIEDIEFMVGSLGMSVEEALLSLGYECPEELTRLRMMEDKYQWIANNKWQHIGGPEAQRIAAPFVEFASYYLEEKLGSLH